MAKFDANWWFGKNSVWQQSGAKSAFTGEGDREGGVSSFFGGLGDALGNFFKKPEVQVDHGMTDAVKYGAVALFVYMVLK
jgi:hypothetical protein